MDVANDTFAQSVLAQTDRVLASGHFSRSATLSQLLRFVVELTLQGKEDELKEYRLGVDVFKRGADFDPRVDPIVRIQAAKLRSRLAEYYASDGRGDVIVISIPKGAYVPQFSHTESGSPPGVTVSPDIQSIAVLPFVSMSSDPENEYFSDGLTEELINVLTYVPGLRVVARTSVFCFKNTAKDIREIGNQLNVRTVLEGSVRRAGNQLRVTAQLIEVSTGFHLLSRAFPREMKDVFTLQEELAGAVVKEIMPQVRGEARPAVREHAIDPAIYSLYLKGMFTLANQYFGPRDCIEIFRQVVEKEPAYAPAWAAIANAYFLQCWFGMMSSKDGMPLAKSAALKALDLDDSIGLAHAMLGAIQAVLDWDWNGAEQRFRRAIQVQPGLAVAYQVYAFGCLLPQRRFDEATAQIERALQLNPFDPLLCSGAILAYTAAGNYEAARHQHALAREVHPNNPLTYGTFGVTCETEGNLDRALQMYRRAAELAPRAPFPLAAIGNVLAQSGDVAGAQKILEQLPELNQSGFAMAIVNLGLGNKSQAIQWLTTSMERREPHLLTVPFDPRFAPLREAPEFQRLLGQMGLAPASA